MKYENNPLISIIIPIYNVEPYLRQCIESVRNQTYKNLEIILVDDGSDDGSSLICDNYAKIDNRIIAIHQKNSGSTRSRKNGLAIATGSIAAYVDSDDWIDLDMYEIMIKKMIESQADVVTSGVYREYKTHCINDIETILSGTYSGKKLDIIKNNMIDKEKFFHTNISVHIYNKLFEINLLKEYIFEIPDEISIGDDIACIHPLILAANKISVINQSFYHYRIRTDSIMGKGNEKDFLKLKVLYQYLSEKYEKNYSSVNVSNQLQLLIIYSLLLTCPNKLKYGEKRDLYYYPQIKRNDNIIIYGKSRAGGALVRSLEASNDFNIIAWIDQNNGIEINKYFFEKLEYDYIIIAVYQFSAYNEIYNNLIKFGVSEKKIAKIDTYLMPNMNIIFDI